MFTVWRTSGLYEPYWGKVDRIQALEALQDHAEEAPVWHLLPEEAAKKVRQVHNFRFVHDYPEEEKEVLIASQIMSFPVVTLHDDQPLSEAWELFHKTRFRHVPILSREGRLVGILSDRRLFQEIYEFGGDKLIKEVMTTDVFSAKPKTPIRRIAQLFVIERIGSMPIVNNEGNLVGIITRSDILRTFSHLANL